MRNITRETDRILVASLDACAKTKDLSKGTRLHADILERGLLEKNPFIASGLIHMYTKCGVLGKAERVIEELPIRSVVSWSALIAGYAQHGEEHKALASLDKMQSEGFSPDAVTFTSVLRVCSSIRSIEKGQKIHEEIMNSGMLETDSMLGAALVNMYAKCGLLAKAQEVLKMLPTRNTISWNALIGGYVQQGQCHEAMDAFQEMQREGLSPDAVSFTCILKACGSMKAIDTGRKIHNEIVCSGLFDKDVVLGNAVVDMYAKCGSLIKARKALVELPKRDTVSWSTLIAGYAQHGCFNEALGCFQQMRSESLYPNEVTYVCLLKACGIAGAIKAGKEIHQEIVNRGLIKKYLVVGNALVDMYVKCGVLSQAQQVLEELPSRNVISWSTLVTGYAQQGLCPEALNCIEQMQREGLYPNAVTFICILKACGCTGAIDEGERIHQMIVGTGLLENDIGLGTALVDMYAKCGMLAGAQKVLRDLPVRDVVAWSALISGYAQQGQGHEALQCFERMQKEGYIPDKIVFICILNACSHSGMMAKAEILFENMLSKYDVTHDLEHYVCMVLAFGCAGDFQHAISVIKAMPSHNHAEVWLTLLSTCRKWGNMKLAMLAFDQVLQLDKSCTAAYVLMADIFSIADMQESAEKVELVRQKHAVSK